MSTTKFMRYLFYPSKVERYTIVYRDKELLFIPNQFCGCKGFYFGVIQHGKVDKCIHLRRFDTGNDMTITDVVVEDSQRELLISHLNKQFE